MPDAEDAWPTKLEVADRGRKLRIAFDDGASFDLSAEYLRVSSPSAEVKGHSRKERKIVGGKRGVAIVGAEPIGSYAVKLVFDDRHQTGIYTWAYLRELGADQSARWGTYLAEIEAAGLSRDHSGESLAGDG